jgi:hypothetical protein
MSYPLPTREIGQIFAQEITALGGRVSETFDNSPSLFTRAILPDADDVQPGDTIHAGVALMATEQVINVHPYTYRQVCTNGAIRAHAIQTVCIVMPDTELEAEYTAATLRDAIVACASTQAFHAGITEMRSALEQQADTVLTLMPMLSRIPGGQGHQFLMSIMQRFFDDADRSSFGLMNAVTSVARDTKNPETRWHLETLGAGVPVWTKHPPKRSSCIRSGALVPA